MSEEKEQTMDSNSMRDYVPQEDADNSDTVAEQESDEVVEQETEKGQPSETKPEKKEEPKEDTFATNFDPTKLPPELQTAYKQMQGDYTKKTQEIAEVRKQAEDYNKYKAFIEYLGRNPQTAQELITRMQNPQNPQNVEEEEIDIPNDPVAFAKFVQDRSVKTSLEQMQKFYQQQEQRKQQMEWINQQAAEAENLDPRLKEDEVFAKIISDMVSNDPLVTSGKKSIVDATKEALNTYDGYFSAKLEAEKQRLSEEAKKKRQSSTPNFNSSVAESKSTPQTMREAYQQSFGK